MSTKPIFRPALNKQTGATEFQFGAILTAINTTAPQKYVNANNEEKVYYLGTIDFVAPNGVEQKGITTQIHAASFDHGITLGNLMLSTLSKDSEGNMWVRTSHLLFSTGVDAVVFDGLDWDAAPKVKAAPAQPAVNATA